MAIQNYGKPNRQQVAGLYAALDELDGMSMVEQADVMISSVVRSRMRVVLGIDQLPTHITAEEMEEMYRGQLPLPLLMAGLPNGSIPLSRCPPDVLKQYVKWKLEEMNR